MRVDLEATSILEFVLEGNPLLSAIRVGQDPTTLIEEPLDMRR